MMNIKPLLLSYKSEKHLIHRLRTIFHVFVKLSVFRHQVLHGLFQTSRVNSNMGKTCRIMLTVQV